MGRGGDGGGGRVEGVWGRARGARGREAGARSSARVTHAAAAAGGGPAARPQSSPPRPRPLSGLRQPLCRVKRGRTHGEGGGWWRWGCWGAGKQYMGSSLSSHAQLPCARCSAPGKSGGFWRLTGGCGRDGFFGGLVGRRGRADVGDRVPAKRLTTQALGHALRGRSSGTQQQGAEAPTWGARPPAAPAAAAARTPPS